MKNLQSYCMLLCFMLAGAGAWAQQSLELAESPTTPENLDASKVYVIYVRHSYASQRSDEASKGEEKENLGYLKSQGTNNRVGVGDTPEDLNYAWTLTRNDDGGIAIRNVSTRYYMPTFACKSSSDDESGFNINSSSAVGTYAASLVESEEAYRLRGYDSDGNVGSPNLAWLNYNTTNGLWVAYDESRAATFQFFEVTNLVDLTINYRHADFTYSVTKTNVIVGTAVADLLDTFDFYTAGAPSAETVTAETASIDVTLTSGDDFPIATDCVYRLNVRGNQTVIRLDDSGIQTTEASNADFVADNLWYFKRKAGTPFFTLHCVGAADASGVTVGTGAAATFSSSPTAFVLRTNSSNANGFSLQHEDNAASCLGDHSAAGNTVNCRLGTWNNAASRNDSGSCFVVTAVPADDIAGLSEAVVGTAASAVDAMYVAGGTKEMVRTQAHVDAAKENATPANVRLLFEGEPKQLDISDYVSADKYYRIVGRGDCFWENSSAYADAEGTVSQEADSRTVLTATADTEGVSYPATLWRFAGLGGNKTKITAANTGFYLGNVDGGNLVTTIQEAWGREYTVVGEGGYWAFRDDAVSGDNYLNCYYNPGYNTGTGLTYWKDGLDDPGNCFRLLEVEEIPVVIGQTGFSTLCLPMAVSVPDGLTAYAATTEAAAGYVHLKELSGTIPAGTGFLVQGTAGQTYGLPIVASPEEADLADATGNILLGARAERRGVGANDDESLAGYFCLNNGGDTPKFSRVNIDGDPVPANKAYILRASLSEAAGQIAALAFDFGGTATDIRTADRDEGSPKAYFDLNGRRVLYPSRGIYVTDDGKKVLFK